MLDALIQLGLFIVEAITIVVAILAIISGIIALSSKNSGKPKIKIRQLNKHYEEIAHSINESILSKKERKALLKAEKKQKKSSSEPKNKPRTFLINFKGDIRAQAVHNLREEITAILTIATPKDEVVICLESPGGVIHGYGLAASQLQRIRDKGIPLTAIIDKVAASGGYMMACVANKILAAPFAIVGSIGVVAQLPNFNRLLKKNHIDFEQITAGEYKRTLTLFGENTKDGREKFQEEINEAHDLFKEFIREHRPQADIHKISTGEHWFAKQAKELNLVDELITSDDYLLQTTKRAELIEVTYKKKKKLSERIAETVHASIDRFLLKYQEKSKEASYL